MSLIDGFDDLGLGETEPAGPGILVQRRCFMASAAAALAGAGIPLRKSLPPIDPAHDRLTYEDFLVAVIPAVKDLVADGSREGQDRYLMTLAAFAVRLAEVPVPEMQEKPGSKTFIGVNPGGDPFTALHWRMEPGTVIGWHAHSYGNVVTLGLEGEVRVGNFEMLGPCDYEAKGTFRVRKTVDQWLRPGETNLVNLERNYVHGFEAGPKGGRGLDLTTRIRPKRRAPVLELGKAPVDPTQSLWEASWSS